MESHRPEIQPLYLLKLVILFLGVVGSVTIGFPSAVLGLAGVLGLLADAGYFYSVRAGLLCLFLSAGIWGATFLCGLWLKGRLPQRFGMQGLLSVLTVAAVVAAAISAVYRMPISP